MAEYFNIFVYLVLAGIIAILIFIASYIFVYQYLMQRKRQHMSVGLVVWRCT